MLSTKEFEEIYSEVELKFDSYYKYMFNFTGTAPDGTVIRSGFGGSSDEIYKFDLDAGEVRKVGHIEDCWHLVNATLKGKAIFDYYDF